MIKADFHTHSTASKDGGISLDQYKKILSTGKLDLVAITDHDRIDFAQKAHSVIGDKIIIGQEITTTDGDVIGLYLTKVIPSGLSARQAADAVHAQGGLFCIPHPFETLRKGVSLEILDSLIREIDIIEGHNGRAVFQNFSSQAQKWALKNTKPTVANSDAHGYKGLGHTYTIISTAPADSKSLMKLLPTSKLVFINPPLITLFYPTKNKIFKKIRRN